jgi:hypothetical protein
MDYGLEMLYTEALWQRQEHVTAVELCRYGIRR